MFVTPEFCIYKHCLQFLFAVKMVPRESEDNAYANFWDDRQRALLYAMTLFFFRKIVCALWLTERRVCIRVCKHGCDVKMFCFSRTNHVSTNLKKFLTSKLDKVTLFTHSFVSWNLENLYKQAESIFFAKADILSQKNPYFWKASFCKTRTDYACKTSRTRLWDW